MKKKKEKKKKICILKLLNVAFIDSLSVCPSQWSGSMYEIFIQDVSATVLSTECQIVAGRKEICKY